MPNKASRDPPIRLVRGSRPPGGTLLGHLGSVWGELARPVRPTAGEVGIKPGGRAFGPSLTSSNHHSHSFHVVRREGSEWDMSSNPTGGAQQPTWVTRSSRDINNTCTPVLGTKYGVRSRTSHELEGVSLENATGGLCRRALLSLRNEHEPLCSFLHFFYRLTAEVPRTPVRQHASSHQTGFEIFHRSSVINIWCAQSALLQCSWGSIARAPGEEGVSTCLHGLHHRASRKRVPGPRNPSFIITSCFFLFPSFLSSGCLTDPQRPRLPPAWVLFFFFFYGVQQARFRMAFLRGGLHSINCAWPGLAWA